MNERARRLRSTIWGRLGIVSLVGTHADRAIDTAQHQVFRFLWLFLPEPSIARNVHFQHLLVSRFLTEGGQQTLTFGALVSVARNGGSALEVAPVGDKSWQKRFPPMRVRARHAVRWLVSHPAVGSMIVLSVLAGIVNVVLVTLAPRYVVAVLDTDPANTAYVFAPGAIGVVFALAIAPLLVVRFGERATSIGALFVCALALFMLGLVEQVGSVADYVNPLHAATWFGIEMNQDMRTAGLLAVPLSFGVSLTATSVQTYVNRRVPIPYQGRTFAIQSTLRNGAAIAPLLTMGAAAAVIGADGVLLISPLVLLVVGYGLVYVSFRISGLRTPRQLNVLESFWEEPDAGAKSAPASGG